MTYLLFKFFLVDTMIMHTCVCHIHKKKGALLLALPILLRPTNVFETAFIRQCWEREHSKCILLEDYSGGVS